MKKYAEMKDSPMNEMNDEMWLRDLAFIVDVTNHMNEFNTKLQNRG